MAAKISTKGSVELPAAMRRKVGLRPGDPVEFKLNGEGIVVTPHKKRRAQKFNAKIIKDPITGYPVLTAGPGAPMITNEEVAEILADFP